MNVVSLMKNKRVCVLDDDAIHKENVKVSRLNQRKFVAVSTGMNCSIYYFD
jgi:hypothetical protein